MPASPRHSPRRSASTRSTRASGRRRGDARGTPVEGRARRRELFAALDHDRSGKIRYHEFLAATLEAEGLVDAETCVEIKVWRPLP